MWGIISLFANVVLLIPSIIAIVSGAIGIARGNRLQREGRPPTGRRLAIAGLVLGVLSAVVTIGLVVTLIVVTSALSYSS